MARMHYLGMVLLEILHEKAMLLLAHKAVPNLELSLVQLPQMTSAQNLNVVMLEMDMIGQVSVDLEHAEFPPSLSLTEHSMQNAGFV